MIDVLHIGNSVPDEETLRKNTRLHINDVQNGMFFIAKKIQDQSALHDHTKLDRLDDFYTALKSDFHDKANWWKYHQDNERHHLNDRVPDDVNLIDVIEYVCDCVMAGMSRSGYVYDLKLDDEVLQAALKNTVELLKSEINLVEPDLMDQPLDDDGEV